jgi:hypothetical protein
MYALKIIYKIPLFSLFFFKQLSSILVELFKAGANFVEDATPLTYMKPNNA